MHANWKFKFTPAARKFFGEMSSETIERRIVEALTHVGLVPRFPITIKTDRCSYGKTALVRMNGIRTKVRLNRSFRALTASHRKRV